MRARWQKAQRHSGRESAAVQGHHPGDVNKGQAGICLPPAPAATALTRSIAASAGSILDGSFLALINEQTMRTTIIAGRPDIGQPDWRNHIPGRAMTDDEITDVSAWLIAQRPATPGQPYPN